MENKNEKYVAYEYKEVTVNKKNAGFWKDGYEAFGWKIEKDDAAVENRAIGAVWIMAAPLSLIPCLGSPFKRMLTSHESKKKIQLQMKRERNLENKMQLNRIQVEFETGAKEIDSLEESRTIVASVVSVSTGLLGAVFMAGSVFTYLEGMLAACAGLAVPGFAAWVAAVLLYYFLKNKRNQTVDRLIDEKQEALEQILKEAYELVQLMILKQKQNERNLKCACNKKEKE